MALAWLPSTLTINLVVCDILERFLEKVLVARFEMVGEAQDLKAVAITDGPNMQLTPVLAPARVTSNLIHGSINALCPAT